jgi:hypothetical protein
MVRGPPTDEDAQIIRVIRVVLAQALAAFTRPAVWDGDLEILCEAGDDVCAGIDVATFRQRWDRASVAAVRQR